MNSFLAVSATLSVETLKEYLPFLIPIVLLELGLFIYAIVHVFRHTKYKCGNRMIWAIVVILGMNFVGPILYLLLGKESE